MANIGEQLLAPESNWKRYEENDSNITLTDYTTRSTDAYGTTGSLMKFQFRGTKFRFIGYYATDGSTNTKVTIDDSIVEYYSSYNTSNVDMTLLYEKNNLQDTYHKVVVEVLGGGYNYINALDIDNTGELRSYDEVVFLNKYLLKNNNQLITINNNEIQVLNSDSQYIPTKLDFETYGINNLIIPKSMIPELNNPKVLVYTDDIITNYTNLDLSVKEKPFLHDKKILCWTDDLESNYNCNVEGQKILNYKTKIDINENIIKNLETEWQNKDNSYNVQLSNLKLNENNVKITIKQDNNTEIIKNIGVNNIVQRNFSLQFDGTNDSYIRTNLPSDFSLENKIIQIIVKPNAGSWNVQTDDGTYITLQENNLYIAKGQNCIIDEIRMWENGKEQEFDNQPLRGNEDGLILYYRFNEFKDNKVFDSSLNGYHGEICNANFVNDIYLDHSVCDAIITTDIPEVDFAIPKNTQYTYNYSIERPQLASSEIHEADSEQDNITTFSVDKTNWENICGLNITKDDELQILGNKISPFSYTIKIDEKDVTLKDIIDISYDVEDTATFNTNIFDQALNPYNNVISITQEDGSIISKTNDILLYDTEPTVAAFLKGKIIHLNIGDNENDLIKFNIYLNNQKIYPLESEFTKLQKPINDFKYTIDSNLIKFQENNVLKITVLDQFGKKSELSTQFIGEYYGLIFMDENRECYTTDMGKLLNYLDFGVITLGQTTEPIKVIMKNTYGFNLKNVVLNINNNLPNIHVELSKTVNPFLANRDKLTFDDVIENDNEVEFYVRLATIVSKQPTSGEFTIDALANPQ